jgi:site-specific recombinase XerD
MDIQIQAQKFYEYSVYVRGYSKDTVRRYKYVINFYTRHAGIENINQISDANIRALFLYGRAERQWQTNTYLCFYKSLLVFFRWCVGQGLLDKNPIEGMKTPKLEKRLPPKLTKQQAMQLVETVYNYPYIDAFLRYRNHAIFSTLIFAGLRKQELLSLKFTDIDIENLTIFVRQGKGKKDRIIPMTYTLAQSLKQYVVYRRKLNKTCPEFFTSFFRNQGFTDAGLKRLVLQIRKASGITFTAHKLRHTFATLMLEGGCDIYSLSKMMGHADIKTTTIYLYASAEHLRLQMGKHPLNDL